MNVETRMSESAESHASEVHDTSRTSSAVSEEPIDMEVKSAISTNHESDWPEIKQFLSSSFMA
jgi:hypothetical protein